MSRSKHWIGFDRRIELSWLDVAAAKVAEGARQEQVQEQLLNFLQSLAYDPKESGSARPKTARVILRIWGAVDPHLRHFNKSCAELFQTAEPPDRLGLHWAMTLAAYPYFFAHADVVGRLLGLQETVSARQIRQRIMERWGERSTVHRTSRHVVRTMVAWGVLEESGQGVYSRGLRRHVVSAPVVLMLLMAVLYNASGDSMLLTQLVGHPALFPFEFDVDAHDLAQSDALQVAQEGVGTVMVGLSRRQGVVAIEA